MVNLTKGVGSAVGNMAEDFSPLGTIFKSLKLILLCRYFVKAIIFGATIYLKTRQGEI